MKKIFDSEVNINRIDLSKPIKLFANKENCMKSLFIWLFVFFIVGIIKPILNANNQSTLGLVIDCSLSFLLFGYFRLYLHNVINDRGEFLPSLNIKKIIITALKLSIILVPFILLQVILFIGHMQVHNSLLKNPPLLVAVITISALVFIVINIYVFFIECAYLRDFEFKEGFRYIKIWKLYKTGWADIIKTYFQAFIILIPLSCIHSVLVFSIKTFSINEIINLSFILSNIYYLIFYTIKINLIGQVYKNVLSQYENTNTIKIRRIKEKLIMSIALFILILLLMSDLIYMEIRTINIEWFNINHLMSLSDLSKMLNLPKYLIFLSGRLLEYTIRYLFGF